MVISNFACQVYNLVKKDKGALDLILKFELPPIQRNFLRLLYDAHSHVCRQGGHIFEKLISLSFLWDFQGIFIFSLSNSREESSLQYIFIDKYITYVIFSLRFPGFSTKIKISRSLP